MKFEEVRNHLSRFTVGIAGAGGLGSNCASSLVRIGVGRLIIADFDIVTESNLNRQFFFHDQIGMPKVDALKINLLRISPNHNISAILTRLHPGNISEVFGQCDIIVEAFDDAGMKVMLAEEVLSALPGVPLVMASGLAGWGKNELLASKQAGENLWICGDGISEVSEERVPLAPRVGIVSNMQANIVTEILMNKIK